MKNNPHNFQQAIIESKSGLYSILRHFIVFLLLLISSNQLIAEEKVTFYHYDLLGSPIVTTDAQGDVIWREEYGPWGEKQLNEDKTHDNVRDYTGHVYDEDTKLTYMQARYYDAEIGRFMGIDPVGFVENNPISFNRYAYANNNPYKFVDPNGELPNELDGGGTIDASLDVHSDSNEDIEGVLGDNPKVATTIFAYHKNLKRASTINSKIGVELGVHVSALQADFNYLGSIKNQIKKGYDVISKNTKQSLKNIPVSIHGNITPKLEAIVKAHMKSLGGNSSLLRSEVTNLPKNTAFGKNLKSGTYYGHVNEMLNKKNTGGISQSSNFNYINKHVIGYPGRH